MSSKLINSAFNYTGNKYKLLNQILPLFPKDFDRFVDLFAGSAVVSINISNIKHFPQTTDILINDIENSVIEFYEYISNENLDNIIKEIKKIIKTYELSITSKYGYDFYDSNSSTGVGNYNKNKYLKLRNDFNHNFFDESEKNIAFYLLTVYGFNNQIRFNKKCEFNLPVGKRDFNKSTLNKLSNFHQAISQNKYRITFSSKDFRNIEIKNNDFIYADPPYSIGTASYNENGGWTQNDDTDLFMFLDLANQKGVRFAMSNVFEHKGKENTYLINWSKKYNVNYLNFNYDNSNYQSKAKINKTVEVLITNY